MSTQFCDEDPATRSASVRAMRSLLLISVALALAPACGSDSDQAPPAPATWPYPQIPAEPQRAGDASKGYDYLINGGYITCGIPKSTYDQLFPNPPVADRLDGRTGDNTNLPFYYSAATSSEGVEVVSANCMTCHASHINGELVVDDVTGM